MEASTPGPSGFRDVTSLTLDEARNILEGANRWELRDHAFGDREIGWDLPNGVTVAEGYIGHHSYISFASGTKVDDLNLTDRIKFEGEDARALAYCGTLTQVSRNDSGGGDY